MNAILPFIPSGDSGESGTTGGFKTYSGTLTTETFTNQSLYTSYGDGYLVNNKTFTSYAKRGGLLSIRIPAQSWPYTTTSSGTSIVRWQYGVKVWRFSTNYYSSYGMLGNDFTKTSGSSSGTSANATQNTVYGCWVLDDPMSNDHRAAEISTPKISISVSLAMIGGSSSDIIDMKFTKSSFTIYYTLFYPN